MSSRYNKWIYICAQLESANTISSLKNLHQRMLHIAQIWQKEGAKTVEISCLINEWHDSVIRRAVKLAVQEMRLAGAGSPPAAFSWAVLGSGGRREQTLAPDQDHALIYDDPDSGCEDQSRTFFQALGNKVTDLLQSVGYPVCVGYVMATNQRWNHSKTGWLHQMETYMEHPDWDNARFLMIAADARHIYGDKKLFLQAKEPFFDKLQQASFVHWQIADRLLFVKTAIDRWGKFRLQQSGEHLGRIDVKEGGYLQLVNAVRVWAIAHGIRNTSTVDRINRLQDMMVWEQSLANRTREAFCELVKHRLYGNYVNAKGLTAEEEKSLRYAFETAKKIQKITAGHFRKPK